MTSLLDLTRRLTQVERAVRRLANVPQLGDSSIEHGSITAYDLEDRLALIIGTQFDGTSSPAVVGGPIPPIPKTPTVEAVMGGLVVSWQGQYRVDGTTTPMDFARVEVHAAPAADTELSVDTLRGVFSSPLGGDMFVSLPSDTEMFVRLVTRSESGKFSAPSYSASGTPFGVAVILLEEDADVPDGTPIGTVVLRKAP